MSDQPIGKNPMIQRKLITSTSIGWSSTDNPITDTVNPINITNLEDGEPLQGLRSVVNRGSAPQDDIILVRRRIRWKNSRSNNTKGNSSKPQKSSRKKFNPPYFIPTIKSNVWKPEILVVSPGGIKGFLYLGALLKFEAIGYLDNIDKYVGCSVGSIICLLLICGYDVLTIFDAAGKTSSIFTNMESVDVTQIAQKAGILSNKLLKEQLTELIKNKFTGIPTMKELYALTGKEFCIVTTLVGKHPVYITRYNYPDMSVVTAVLLSSNIPGVFHKMILEQDGQAYCDGALSDPYPIRYYDDGKAKILGLYIESESSNDIGGYLSDIVYTPLRTLRAISKKLCSSACRHLELLDSPRTIGGFNISDEIKVDMTVCGYNYAHSFYQELVKNSQKPKQHVIEKGRIFSGSAGSTITNTTTLSQEFLLKWKKLLKTYLRRGILSNIPVKTLAYIFSISEQSVLNEQNDLKRKLSILEEEMLPKGQALNNLTNSNSTDTSIKASSSNLSSSSKSVPTVTKKPIASNK